MLHTKNGKRIVGAKAAAALLAALGLSGVGVRAGAAHAAGGRQVSAAPGAWSIDVAHTSINFSVRHMVVSQVRGRFNQFGGTLAVAGADLSGSSVRFTIQAASIDTNQPQRDAHLKTSDFFDVAKYPTITFRSSSITKNGAGYVAHGAFTMHGTTKEIDLPFQLSGPVKDAFGTTRIGLQSRLRLNRQDYGVRWNMPLDNGGLAVGNDVDIEINLEATPAKPAAG